MATRAYNKPLVATRNGEALLLAGQRRRQSSGDTVQSVREQLVRRFEPFTRKGEPDETLGDALYAMLRLAGELGICVDGWTVFKVRSESSEHLEGVGLMTLLPGGSIPIAISVSASAGKLTWVVQLGEEDEEWRSFSASKRWKIVYLYASDTALEPQWSWGRQYRGVMDG